MKKILISCLTLLLLCAAVQAHALSSAIQAVVSVCGTACTNSTVTLHQTLEATDFLTSPPSGWTVTDTTSRLSMSTSGEKLTIKCFNSTVDEGVRGLAASLATTTTVGFATYTLPSALASVTFGVWYKTVALPSYAGNTTIARIHYSTKYTKVYQTRSSADNHKHFSFSIDTGGIVNTAYTINDDTWYWLTFSHNNNGEVSFNAYDTTGNALGDAITGTAPADDATSIDIGLIAFPAVDTTAYFDDFVYVGSSTALIAP